MSIAYAYSRSGNICISETGFDTIKSFEMDQRQPGIICCSEPFTDPPNADITPGIDTTSVYITPESVCVEQEETVLSILDYNGIKSSIILVEAKLRAIIKMILIKTKPRSIFFSMDIDTGWRWRHCAEKWPSAKSILGFSLFHNIDTDIEVANEVGDPVIISVIQNVDAVSHAPSWVGTNLMNDDIDPKATYFNQLSMIGFINES